MAKMRAATHDREARPQPTPAQRTAQRIQELRHLDRAAQQRGVLSFWFHVVIVDTDGAQVHESGPKSWLSLPEFAELVQLTNLRSGQVAHVNAYRELNPLAEESAGFHAGYRMVTGSAITKRSDAPAPAPEFEVVGTSAAWKKFVREYPSWDCRESLIEPGEEVPEAVKAAFLNRLKGIPYREIRGCKV